MCVVCWVDCFDAMLVCIVVDGDWGGMWNCFEVGHGNVELCRRWRCVVGSIASEASFGKISQGRHHLAISPTRHHEMMIMS